ncbi:MAG: hypothetical protein KDD45_03135 [Bdellovibrionales bacterium]|nr:hypothetical protein [Bdellovibrionales bacterium]
MKSKYYFLIGLSVFIISCSTSKKSNTDLAYVSGSFAPKNTGLEVALTETSNFYHIEIKGTAICNNFMNYNNLIVELYDDDRISSTAKVDIYGNFKSRFKTNSSKHNAKLINKINGAILAQQEFTSSEIEEKVRLNLKACEK